jgi:MoaA/NifB/PqqE/SkfB family radical SAM enzyme
MLGMKSLPTLASQAKTVVKDLLESGKWPRRPEHLGFEITGACDAKCIHCPRQEMDRPKRQMPFELFRRLVDQAAEMRVPDLVPNGYGEILLIKNLGDYLDYIASKRHRFRILCNTNGHMLTDEKIDLFIKHRVSLLNITIDGATPETAQAVRVGLDTRVIEDNIHRLIRRRNALGRRFPRIRVGMILIPQNRHEADAFMRKWRGVTEFVGLAGFSTRLGSMEGGAAEAAGAGEAAAAPDPHPCVLPFRELHVWSDGKAVLCCEDWNEQHVVGDLNAQTLQEIWHGAVLREARRLHAAGQGDRLAICARCNAWRKPSLGARLWV